MQRQKQDILEAAPRSLAHWLEEQREPPYRLQQVLTWLYAEQADSFSAMSNLPLALRSGLEEAYRLSPVREVGRLRSGDGASGKLVLALEDGEEIESVWMRDGQRRTFCISSQAGCALGCTFCATGAAGFGRNLKLGEILGQVMSLARAEGWPANIVVMGMGEPLLNLDAVVPALESLSDPQRFGLGVRRITVSTAGVTPAIWELSRCSVRPNLALSLNSPFNAQRSELMPVNRRYPLSGVLKACKAYGESSGRHVLFEYLLLGGVNTSPPAACAVARLAREAGAWVNLIPFNPVPGCGFHPPERQEVQRFRAALEERGVRVTERFRRGRDILAACGQLRGKHPDGAVSRCPAVAQKQP